MAYHNTHTLREYERALEVIKNEARSIRHAQQILWEEGIKFSLTALIGMKRRGLPRQVGSFSKTVIATPGWRPEGPLSFEEFCQKFFPHDMSLPPAVFHSEIKRLLPVTPLFAIAAPRSFAKSTIVAKHYVLYRALTWKVRGEKKKPNILLLSSSGTEAKARLALIREELEENAKLLINYGDQRFGVWTQTLLHLKNGVKIAAKGKGAKIRGPRPTIILCDDLEDDEEVLSEFRRRKTQDWFWKAMFNTLEPDSQLVVIGTLIHPLALMTDIIKNPRPGFTIRLYKAIDEEGRPTWPAKWPMDVLEARRATIGIPRFEAEFMNEPIVATEEPYVKRDWLALHFKDDPPPLSAYSRVVMAVDPAIGKSHESDESGIVVFGQIRGDGKDFDRHSFCLRARRGKWSIYELVAKMIETIREFKREDQRFLLVLETNMWQSSFRDVFQHEARNQHLSVSVKEIRPRADKGSRLKAVTPWMERGFVHFKSTQEDAIEQLTQFPHGRKDIADAIAHALTEIYGNDAPTLINLPQSVLAKDKKDSIAKLFPELSLDYALRHGQRPSVRVGR